MDQVGITTNNQEEVHRILLSIVQAHAKITIGEAILRRKKGRSFSRNAFCN